MKITNGKIQRAWFSDENIKHADSAYERARLAWNKVIDSAVNIIAESIDTKSLRGHKLSDVEVAHGAKSKGSGMTYQIDRFSKKKRPVYLIVQGKNKYFKSETFFGNESALGAISEDRLFSEKEKKEVRAIAAEMAAIALREDYS